ncbi:hypothetical protein [Streptomyces xiamenensis]|uniref:hypothetical protein n=1 Tax=Streptomyces xiamenensis TaxID=408015 RepID=UPI00143D016D|nr:hypothetical protein [Streptomyces xiamenensis]
MLVAVLERLETGTQLGAQLGFRRLDPLPHLPHLRVGQHERDARSSLWPPGLLPSDWCRITPLWGALVLGGAE